MTIAFLFPGQGAQAVGMGSALYKSLPAAESLFHQANEILGYDLARLCFSGPAEDLNSTVHSQPALFVASLAALESLRASSPEVVAACAATAGLSLGEYTALVFAGVMDFADALRVVQKRGQAMQDASDAVKSGMVSILGLEVPDIERLCAEASQGDVLQIANFLCPGNTVCSGTEGALKRLMDLAETAGGKTVPLSVAGAFHTSIMHPADERLAEALSSVSLRAPRIPVISNVDGRPHSNPDEIRDLLVRQLVSPVRWEASMRQMIDQGCDSWYEIGPGRVLRGLLRRIDKAMPCESVSC